MYIFASKSARRVAALSFSVLVLVSAQVSASPLVPIDLNDFFADPSVTVAPDGSSATLAEDALLSPVLLSNDPGVGDPEVVVPGANIWLVLDYIFTEPSGNVDEFGAFVVDAATGLSVGSPFEFFLDSTGSGAIAWDLSSLAGRTLGLQFLLSAYFSDSGLDSTVTVSSVVLEQRVDIPATPALLLVGTEGRVYARGCVPWP